MRYHKAPAFKVEHKRRNSPAGPGPAASGAPADRRIRTWSADAPPKPRPLTWFDYLEKQVEIAIYRLRQANDETVVKEAAEAVAYREEAQRVTATMLPVRHAHFGDCLLLVPREEHKALLVKALQKLLPKVSLWKPRPEDARMPRALKPFMRAMGKAGE